jgi:hypothetical protein
MKRFECIGIGPCNLEGPIPTYPIPHIKGLIPTYPQICTSFLFKVINCLLLELPSLMSSHNLNQILVACLFFPTSSSLLKTYVENQGTFQERTNNFSLVKRPTYRLLMFERWFLLLCKWHWHFIYSSRLPLVMKFAHGF